MPILRPRTIFAAALCVALPFYPPAMAQETAAAPQATPPSLWEAFSFENIASSLVRSALSSARVLADIRYDQISVDPAGSQISLTGLLIAPNIPDLGGSKCQITAEDAAIRGTSILKLDQGRARIALSGVQVGMGCLEKDVAQMVRAAGVSPLRMEQLSIDLTYDYASGGADITIATDIDQVAAVEAHIVADYISYRMDWRTEEPELAVDLASAEVIVDDRGGWSIAQQLMPAGMFQPDTLAGLVKGGLSQVLGEMNAGQPLSDRQTRLAAQAGALAKGFANGRRRIVLSTNVGGGSLRLNERAAGNPVALFDALNPTLSDHSVALTRAVPVAELSAALNGDTLPANALDLGRALATGIGAPRNLGAARKMLTPLANGGNVEAAMILARALETEAPSDAYAYALRAGAARMSGALALMDRLERTLSYEAITKAQNAAMADGPDPALYASALKMRRAARQFSLGIGRGRSYRAAYYWASMAAAAGDASGAQLREDLNDRMALRGFDATWSKEAASLDAGVLRDWMGQNVPAKLRD